MEESRMIEGFKFVIDYVDQITGFHMGKLYKKINNSWEFVENDALEKVMKFVPDLKIIE
jgi:hypothetical protein